MANARSLRALDWLNFFLADVQTGFGPFIASFLASKKWTQGEIGLMLSVGTITAMASQIPAGVLLDHFGARRVTASVLFCAAAGALIFALSHDMSGLMLGRLLIGVGASVCLGGAFKATAQYFPVAQLTLVNGLVMAVGGLGGVAVGAPLSQLLTIVPWRSVSLGLAVFTACVASIIWLGAPAAGVTASRATIADQLKGTLHILRSRAFWKIATFSGLTQAVFYAMQSLWIGTFLRDVVPASATAGAARIGTVISVFGGAFIVGNIGFGALARAFERRGMRVQTFSGLTMLSFVVVQGLLAARVALPETMLWAAYGALGGTGILTYAVLAEYFPATLIGRANTTFTLVIFVGIFVAQNAIGAALSHWTAIGGHYPVIAHQVVWTALIVIQAMAALWYFLPSRARAESA